MRRVRLSALAVRDLDEIWHYIATESGSTHITDRMIDAITKRIALIGRSPKAGSRREQIEHGVRGFPVGNYVIYYREAGSSVDIARVLHRMRDQRSAYKKSE